MFPPIGLAVSPFAGLSWAPFAAEIGLALLARLALVPRGECRRLVAEVRQTGERLLHLLECASPIRLLR